MCRDGELDLLCTGAIRDGSVPARYRRDPLVQVDMFRLELPDTARQPHGELVICDGDEHTRAFVPAPAPTPSAKPYRYGVTNRDTPLLRVQHHPVANVLCSEKSASPDRSCPPPT